LNFMRSKDSASPLTLSEKRTASCSPDGGDGGSEGGGKGDDDPSCVYEEGPAQEQGSEDGRLFGGPDQRTWGRFLLDLGTIPIRFRILDVFLCILDCILLYSSRIL
jgi:hypothetical protein